MREFFAKRGIQPGNEPAPLADKPMVDTAAGPDVADDEDDENSAIQRLAGMSVPQKMARATKGTREERAILIRDPNKLIAVTVLSKLNTSALVLPGEPTPSILPALAPHARQKPRATALPSG